MKLTLMAEVSGGSADVVSVAAGTSRISWNAQRRRWTTCPGMLNSSMKPNLCRQKSVDAAWSDVETVRNTGVADAAEHLRRDRVRSALSYRTHVECVEEITHEGDRPPSRHVRVKPNLVAVESVRGRTRQG